MKSKELTIVIVTFKSENKISNCLNSIPDEIPTIIVENSNNEKFKKEIESNFKNVKCILMNENKGYAIANSIISYDGKVPFFGLKQATWQTNVDVDNIPSWVTAKGISKEESAKRLEMWNKTIKPLLKRLKGGNLLDLGI